MKINILIPSTSSLNISNNGANIQGDELVARLWAKYLSKRPEITSVTLNDNSPCDINISFSPLIQHDRSQAKLNILYLQNVFPKPAWPGTVEMFHQNKSRYDAFIFPSNGLKKTCDSNGLVCQFAVDPELFYPDSYDAKFDFANCFVGNNIRNQQTTQTYILSAAKYGLAIFGNPSSWNSPYCRGKISIEDERKLYSSSKICLNAHLDEHLEYGSFNFRIFNILACKGFILSDRSIFLENEFNDCIVFVDNEEDLLSKIDYYLKNQDLTLSYRNNGFDLVTTKHTFANRINDIINWIQSL